MSAEVSASPSDSQDRVIYSPSWGAAVFSFLYLLSMRAWKDAMLALILNVIPLVNIAAWIYYMVNGKRIAWRTRQWRDFQDFLKCQRAWDRWAKWWTAALLLIGLLAFAINSVTNQQERATDNSQQPRGDIPTQCGVERWAVKTLTDPASGQVNLVPKPATVEELTALPVPDGFGRDARRLEPEFLVYTVAATLVEFKEEADSDIHLVILGASGQSMIAEIPDPGCAQGSRALPQISRARAQFVDRFGQPSRTSWHQVDVPIRVTGVLFFDVHHGQTGVAPNAVELHPVVAIGP